jgi:hypothetical protein
MLHRLRGMELDTYRHSDNDNSYSIVLSTLFMVIFAIGVYYNREIAIIREKIEESLV